MRAVLDTNIVVSRYLVAVDIPAQIISAWQQDRFEVVVSPALLAEYERVLNYRDVQRRHHLSSEDISYEVAAFAAAALVVEPGEVPALIIADPADDQVLAAAVAGVANYIVSGDPHLLDLREYRGIRAHPGASDLPGTPGRQRATVMLYLTEDLLTLSSPNFGLSALHSSIRRIRGFRDAAPCAQATISAVL
jgi:uncharacterized protein